MVKPFIYIIGLLVLLISCSEQPVREGEVKYSIHYPNIDSSSYLLNVLPDTLIYTFKGDLAKSDIVLSSGLIRISFLIDSQDSSMTEFIKMSFNKIYYKHSKEEVNILRKDFPSFTFTETNQEKVIAGKKSTKTLIESNGETIPLYSTKLIESNNSNWYNPYKGIDGFLMKYRMKQFGFDMVLKAEKVIERDVHPDEFKVPSDYVKTSKQELERTHNLFLEVGL